MLGIHKDIKRLPKVFINQFLFMSIIGVEGMCTGIDY